MQSSAGRIGIDDSGSRSAGDQRLTVNRIEGRNDGNSRPGDREHAGVSLARQRISRLRRQAIILHLLAMMSAMT